MHVRSGTCTLTTGYCGGASSPSTWQRWHPRTRGAWTAREACACPRSLRRRRLPQTQHRESRRPVCAEPASRRLRLGERNHPPADRVLCHGRCTQMKTRGGAPLSQRKINRGAGACPLPGRNWQESALATPGHLLRTGAQQTAEARGAWATTLIRRGPMSSLERTLRAGPLDPALPACASTLRRRAPARGRRGRGGGGAISPRPTDFALLRAAEAAHVQAEAALACVSCGRLRTQRGWRASGKGSRPCATGRDAPRTTQRPPSSDHSWQQTANRLRSTHPPGAMTRPRRVVVKVKAGSMPSGT